MRELDVHEVAAAVKTMCITANYDLPRDVYDALKSAQAAEESPVGREILGQLVENADIAAADRVPICQDTGFAVFFAEVGQDVHFVGGAFEDAINEGVRQGYGDGYLRKSVAEEPAQARRNTNDNTPAILHTSIVPGDRVRLTMMAKGGGAENMSSLNMLKPAQGWEGMSQAVVDTVSRAGSNPCPPVVIGV
ncbi:MAG: fumarate hydratase, partial [Thermoleophilia bacterium]